MAYNFKSIADVEVVAEPTESANVLIEENGVIKKAPKTAVGGNGEWDAVIEQTEGYINNYENYRFKEGGYDTIKATWDKGELPKVLFEYVDSYGCNYYHRAPSDAIVYAADDDGADDNMYFFLFFNINEYSNSGKGTLRIYVKPDNSFARADWSD